MNSGGMARIGSPSLTKAGLQNENLPNEKLDNLPEARKCKTALIVTATADNYKILKRYSSIRRLIRVTAYWLRYFGNLRKTKELRKTGYLEVSQRAHA